MPLLWTLLTARKTLNHIFCPLKAETANSATKKMQKLYGYFWTNFLDCNVLLLELTNPKFRSVLLHFQKYPNKDYTIILPSKKSRLELTSLNKFITNNQQEPKDFGADFLKEIINTISEQRCIQNSVKHLWSNFLV